jgi:diaminopimelate decarboxylase
LLFPVTYRVNAAGHMEVGGCDLVELARQHGTPLYIYDEATVRQRASEYVAAMGSAGQVLYSAKAFASLRIVPAPRSSSTAHTSSSFCATSCPTASGRPSCCASRQE